MNREQRRKYARDLKRNGITREAIDTFVKMAEANDLKTGDTVKVKVDQIKASKAYETALDKYKEFVNRLSGDETFEICVEENGLVSLNGHPWLFWSGDLQRVKEVS